MNTLTKEQKIELLARRPQEWDLSELIGFACERLRAGYRACTESQIDSDFDFYFDDDEDIAERLAAIAVEDEDQ